MTPANPFDTAPAPEDEVQVAGLGKEFAKAAMRMMGNRRLTPEENAAGGRIDFPGEQGDNLDNAADGTQEPTEAPQPPPEATVEQTADILSTRPERTADKYAGNINLDRLEEPDGFNFVLERTAEQLAPEVDEARRGRMSQEATQGLAREMGLTVDELLSRRAGEAWNAEQILAAREILVSSRNEIATLARQINQGGASDEDMIAFRRKLARHQAIQLQVSGLAAEAGRALSQFRILAEEGDLRTQEVNNLLESTGGTAVVRRMAAAINDVASRPGADPATINRAINNVSKATTWDMITEYWINGLLSSPATHAVNATSNALVTIWTAGERALAGLNPGGEIQSKEALASLYGLVMGWQDYLRIIGKSLKAIVTQEPSDPMGKIEARRFKNITAENIRALTNSDPALVQGSTDMSGPVTRAGRVLDMTVNGFGYAARVPGSFLQGADELFKALNYRMELRAQAFRKGLEGDAAKGFMNDVLAYQEAISTLQAKGEEFTQADILAEMQKRGAMAGKTVEDILLDGIPGVHMQADYMAHYNTFTKDLGDWGKNFQTMVNRVPPLRFIFPFIRTPINITKFVGERTPISWMSSAVRAELAAGGARRQMALAKMEAGSLTAAAMTTMVLANSDCENSDFCITGMRPADPREASTWDRLGIQEYSVKLGGKWHAYNRLDPLGWMMGAITDAANIIDIVENDSVEANEVAAAVVLGISHNLINKTYLSGISDLLEVFHTQDKDFAGRYVQRFGTSFLPMSSLGGYIAGQKDPYLRDIDEFMDQVKSRVLFGPGGEGYPVKRDFWGKPRKRTYGLSMRERVSVDNPVDKEFLRLGWSPSMPRREIQGVDLTRKEYSDYMEMFGEEVDGHTLQSILKTIIESDAYKTRLHDDLDLDGNRAEALSKAVSKWNSLTQARFIQANRRIREELKKRAEQIQGALQ